jgi:hypothetical protein
MPSDDLKDAAIDPSLFKNRFLLEIEGWDCELHVGLSSDLTPVEYRFQGGLNYVRGFNLECRVVAPKAHDGKSVRVWLSPFGLDVKFGTDGLDEVGQLHIHSPQPEKPDYTAALLIPESALPVVATCLGSSWKYVHIWTFDHSADAASVSAFSFSSDVHKNLEAWIASN